MSRLPVLRAHALLGTRKWLTWKVPAVSKRGLKLIYHTIPDLIASDVTKSPKALKTELNDEASERRKTSANGRWRKTSPQRSGTLAATSSTPVHQDQAEVPSQPSSSRSLQDQAEVPPQPNSIPVTVDGTAHLFGPLLLRDICQCERCVDPSTRQKLFCTSEIPADIQAASSYADEMGISVRWTTDVPGFDPQHTTHIDMSQLRSIIRDGATSTRPSLPRRVVWDDASLRADVDDIDYHTYMEDDFALHTAVQQLRTHGLLFLTNVPEDPSSVINITERIGPVKNTFYGFTWDVRSVPQAKNVAYTSQDLGFHMDLMYMQQPPHLQFLHCIRSSSQGGASLFTDSFKAVRDLFNTDLLAFQRLSQIKVPFHYDHPGSEYYLQKRNTVEVPVRLPVHNVTNASIRKLLSQADQLGVPRQQFIPIEQLIEAVAWSPPFQAPFSTGAALYEKFPELASAHPQPGHANLLANSLACYNREASKFNKLIHRTDGIYERMMKPGECVLFDNRRVLHARRAFDVADAGKERWLRGSYMDKDPFMSKLSVLQDRFGVLPVKSQQGLNAPQADAATA